MSAKFRLGTMMFLEYAIWGAWAPILSAYLIERPAISTARRSGFIYGLLPIATIIAPLIGGQLADRYFPTEKVIAVMQLLGGIILLLGAAIQSYSGMVWIMLIYCLVYAPTLALTNSIAFINLKNSEKTSARSGSGGRSAGSRRAGRSPAGDSWRSQRRRSRPGGYRSFWQVCSRSSWAFWPSASPTRLRRRKAPSRGPFWKPSKCSKTRTS